MTDLRVLVVDDEMEFGVKVQKEIIKQSDEIFNQPARVSVLDDATHALKSAEPSFDERGHPVVPTYDLVVLDVDLKHPEISGIDVLTAFKETMNAWVVSVLTGIEKQGADVPSDQRQTDPRTNLHSIVKSRFWPDRVFPTAKPSSDAELPSTVERILRFHHDTLSLQSIFRRSELGANLWEVRFRSGRLKFVPEKQGFPILQRLLRSEPITTADVAREVFGGNKLDGRDRKGPHANASVEATDALFNTILNEVRRRKMPPFDRTETATSDSAKLRRLVELCLQVQTGDIPEHLKRELTILSNDFEERLVRLVAGRIGQVSGSVEPARSATNPIQGRMSEQKAKDCFRTWKKRWIEDFHSAGLPEMAEHVRTFVGPRLVKGAWTYETGLTWRTDA